MNDIFISHAREDRVKVEVLSRALQRRGWSVWLDSKISAGTPWDEEIERALKEAKCVSVLWSKASLESDWVREEAEEGRKRGILVPAKLEDIEIPLGFRRIQTIDLTNWQGAEEHEGVEELLRAIARILKRPPGAEVTKDRSENRRRWKRWCWPAPFWPRS